MFFHSQNPVNDEVVANMPSAEEADIEAAVEAAQKAQPAWAAQPAHVRTTALRKFAALMTEHATELGEV